MNIDKLTDIAYEVVSELEPARSIDVFDVSEAEIIFQDERGLVRVCVLCLSGSIKEQIKRELCE
jgi:hypothetical protein